MRRSEDLVSLRFNNSPISGSSNSGTMDRITSSPAHKILRSSFYGHSEPTRLDVRLGPFPQSCSKPATAAGENVMEIDWKRIYQKNFRMNFRKNDTKTQQQPPSSKNYNPPKSGFVKSNFTREPHSNGHRTDKIHREREEEESKDNDLSRKLKKSKGESPVSSPNCVQEAVNETDDFEQERHMYLNDSIIDAYLSIVANRNATVTGTHVNCPSVYAFTTFFYKKFRKENYSPNLKRWTKNVDIFSYDLIYFPIHGEDCDHWFLVVADTRNRTIKYYDSLPAMSFGRCTEVIYKYLRREHKERKDRIYNFGDWTLETVRNLPHQLNGYDCGVFLCKFADLIAQDCDVTLIEPTQMERFRKEIAKAVSVIHK